MSHQRPRVVLCRTCVRDNPGKAPFSDFEENAKFYQSLLKEGFLKKTADLHYQNCFAQCENFHCVLVSYRGQGFLLKGISTETKAKALVAWLKELKQGKEVQLSKELEGCLLKKVNQLEKYPKYSRFHRR